jgi:hypothetical protein
MKTLFVSIFCLISSLSFSQMTMTKLNGTPINNGDIITFNTAVDPGSYLGYKIYNSSPDDINVKVRIVSIVNAPGSNLQLCIGPICVNNLIVGNVYPSNLPVVIPANGENGNFDHFLNTYSNGSTIIDYVLKFFQVDDAGVEIGNSITFTYRYNPNLGTTSFNQENLGAMVKSTIVGSQLDLNVTKNGIIRMYDLNGKLVQSSNLSVGEQSIDTSNLVSGSYILNYTNDEGQTSSMKIIKK